MGKTLQNQFEPDYASPPGETLAEVLAAQGMSQSGLAERTGRPKKTINEIIRGKERITPETALQLEKVLGVPASFWNNLESNYQETLARIQERTRLKTRTAWLKKLPLQAMIERGWVPQCQDLGQQLDEVLKFFGVASPEGWNGIWAQTQVAFRRSLARECDPYSVSAWIRQGEIIAQQIHCSPYDRVRFEETLKSIRPLTIEPPEIFQAKLIECCAHAGVAVAFVPELPKARISGLTRWLSPRKALIQLSLLYKTDDHLWFTFFHEAGHILMHGKRNIFSEGKSGIATNGDEKEEAANRFGRDFLIPPVEYQSFLQRLTFPSKAAIRAFGQRIGIAPGIVVGRLQHDRHLPYTHCNDLKRRLHWAGF